MSGDKNIVAMPNDRRLMGFLRDRVAADAPMTTIAAELGVGVDDLCAWIMAYKEPRHRYVDNSKGGAAILVSDGPVRDHWSLSESARRFEIWRKSHYGARAARQNA